MANVFKQSVRIELDPAEFDNVRDLFEETLYEAISRLVADDAQESFLTSQFFTMRFDAAPDGGLAATMTASEKKG